MLLTRCAMSSTDAAILQIALYLLPLQLQREQFAVKRLRFIFRKGDPVRHLPVFHRQAVGHQHSSVPVRHVKAAGCRVSAHMPQQTLQLQRRAVSDKPLQYGENLFSPHTNPVISHGIRPDPPKARGLFSIGSEYPKVAARPQILAAHGIQPFPVAAVYLKQPGRISALYHQDLHAWFSFPLFQTAFPVQAGSETGGRNNSSSCG